MSKHRFVTLDPAVAGCLGVQVGLVRPLALSAGTRLVKVFLAAMLGSRCTTKPSVKTQCVTQLLHFGWMIPSWPFVMT